MTGDGLPGDLDDAYQRIESVRSRASSQHGYPVRVVAVESLVVSVDLLRLRVRLSTGETFDVFVDLDTLDPFEGVVRTYH